MKKTHDSNGVPPFSGAAAVPATSGLSIGNWTSPSGLTYQISAVHPQIIRIRIGALVLPEDASWAVPPAARVPLACATAAGKGLSLTTADVSATLDGDTGLITISDKTGTVLWQDAATPIFHADGSFTFSGVIPKNSHFYGLGDKADAIDKSGKSYVNWNTDTTGTGLSAKTRMTTMPFFMRKSGATYTGYFFDSTWRSTFDFGETSSTTLTLGAAGGGIDYYVIAGKSPKEVLRNYSKLLGTTPLPNLWALGWQQSRYTYPTAAAALAIAKKYRDMNIPADVLWTDIGFQYNNYPFTVGANYAPYDTFVKNMAEIDFKVVAIADLHIAQQDANGLDIPNMPSGTYAPYREGHARGLFIKGVAGNELSARVWPPDVDSVFPDFTRKQVREWFGGLYRQFYVDYGVAGIWNDMNEPAIFDVPAEQTMPDESILCIEEPGFRTRAATFKELHNVLGMQNHRATYEGLLALKPDQRPFVLTRSSFSGGHRFGQIWTGDIVSSWENLRVSTNQIASLGLAGWHAGADIGGFLNGPVPTASLLTRWIQLGSFYPFSRDHYDDNRPPQEPWEIQTRTDIDIRTKYIRNRYALMPYLYAVAEEVSRTGVPMMRRMFLEFPDAMAPGAESPAVPIDIAAETQFMIGPHLLVAPSPIEQGFKPGPVATMPLGTILGAENTDLSGGAWVNTNRKNHTGTGFVDGLSNPGANLSARLSDIQPAGSYEIHVRYANGPSSSLSVSTGTLSVYVDSVKVSTMNFASTGDWDTWRIATLPLQLTGGHHDIVLACTGDDRGNINIDSLAVTVSGTAYPTRMAPTISQEQRNIQAPYDVLLPPGQWYDYWTGKRISAPCEESSSWVHHIANPTIADIPVFVRAGSIIPKVPPEFLAMVRSTADVIKMPILELSVYPGDNGSGSIYVDDGSSFAYKKGVYYRRNYTCTVSGNAVIVNFGAVEGDYQPPWTTVNVSVAGSTVPKTVKEAAGASSVSLPIGTQ